MSTTLATPAPSTSIHPKHSAPLSPAVLHLLTLNGISDATKITATGPKGRLLKGDVLAYLGKIEPRTKTSKEQGGEVEKEHTRPSPTVVAPTKTARESSEYVDIPLTKKDEVARVTKSKSSIPHSYISKSINIDELLKFRQTFNEQFKTNITINDFFVKAASMALRKSPELNVRYDPTSENLTSKNTDIDISVGVATPSESIQPVIRKTEEKGLKTIFELIKELSSKAKESKLLPEDISNLGVDEFTGIINPPQSSILTIGSTRAVTKIPEVIDITDKTNNSDILDYLGSKPDSRSSSSSSSLSDDETLNIIEYLGGVIPSPKSMSSSHSSIESQKTIQNRLAPRVDASHIVNVQLSIDERVVDPVVAAEFLDRFSKVTEAPERILL
ncbi:11197_t:CDS:2 [Ambispora leptoticha]|uniref:11197_t:CDS:1 n=1 Tax=Ambispora leptoticha TaxID=144679 RepID=A0A9N8WJF4_9GLOM|nr:11197_t:CDS:2 [Ambispora leptoticha]